MLLYFLSCLLSRKVYSSHCCLIDRFEQPNEIKRQQEKCQCQHEKLPENNQQQYNKQPFDLKTKVVAELESPYN
jgi:hypothetical protein